MQMTSKLSKLIENTIAQNPMNGDSLMEKEIIIHKNKVENQYNDIQEREQLSNLVNTLDISLGNKLNIDRYKKENKEYFEDLKSMIGFLNNDFKQIVQLFPKTVTLVLARTGEGKSTLSANLAHTFLKQGKRVLQIVNEERGSDCYNRVTSLIKKWHYQAHDEFTEEQQDTFNQYISILSQKMNVVDNYDNNGNVTGISSSIEGIENILKSAVKLQQSGNGYEVIVLDYYQNVSESIKNPKIETWQAQEKLCKILDKYKNLLSAPIVVLAQMKAGKEGEDTDYKELIEGRKAIANVSTTVLASKADKENFRTEWICKKSRWSSAVGKSVFTGYKYGKYVQYNKTFTQEIEHKMQDIETARIIRNSQQKIGERE